MNLIWMLLFLLGGCVVVGVIRKIRGGTFMPPPGSDGDNHVRDKSGRWWRHEPENNVIEELYGRREGRVRRGGKKSALRIQDQHDRR